MLILTDGEFSTQEAAKQIAATFPDSRILTAREFTGVEILSPDAYFFGCAEPDPPSFAYLETVLQHINLVGRPCGIFSPQSEYSSQALEYLSRIVVDSELALYPHPFLAEGQVDIASWAVGVLGRE
ncbi:hypothetical protein FACS1894172_04480 [Spirochaetia bacterium]|nr:hypothetical protein FACS1894164_02870 [Spirochaetia bacterium]GHU30724.1 hypothetical protein FACS1894172_04480 [Spirochaetia bacterium]